MEKIEVKCAYDSMVELEKLIPNPKNPNCHPDKQVKALCKIIKSTGWRAPITISRQSGLIVRGHGRFLAAIELKCDKVPVDYQNYENDAQELGDLVADNRIAELSKFDDDLLKNVLNQLQPIEIDLELTAFTEKEIEKILNDTQRSTYETIDEEYLIVIKCSNEGEQSKLLTKFNKEGLECRALIS